MKTKLRNSCLFIIILCQLFFGIACQEEEKSQNHDESKEAKIAAINICSDTDKADFFLLSENGSYILCDAENEKGYSVLYMNEAVDNDFDSGLTVFLDEKGTPVMASLSKGHFVFNNIKDDSFDFAYINNQNEAFYFYDVMFDSQTRSSNNTRGFFDPWIEAFKSPTGGGWDEHNLKAIVPFLCKIVSFAITACDAVWGVGQFALLQTFASEIYKSSDYRNKWFDLIFTGSGIYSLATSGLYKNQGVIVFTPKEFGISALANLLNKYADEELDKLGRIEEQVGPVLDPEEWKISLSNNYLDCTPDDSVYVVDVFSKAMWEIDDSQIDHSWCEVKKLEGQVAIHVKPNKQEYDRNCNLIISPKTTMGIVAIGSVTLPIKQTGIVFELSPDKLTFLMFGGSEPVLVKTNEFINEWKVTSWPSWCNYEKATTTLWVRVDKNEIEDRDGYITITGITKGGMFIDRQLKVEQKAALCPDDNHPHAISLGLPSGTKWACCNVEGWYSWGETEPKAWYNMGWYKYFDNEKYECKYIGSDIAGTQYDVAHVKWGASWHMPSRAQFQELLDNCTSVLDSYYGLHRGIFVGPNRKAIYLPFAGFLKDDYGLGVGSTGFYWSSTCNENEPNCAYYLRYEHSSGPRMCSGDSYYTRFYGFSVRPVQ